MREGMIQRIRREADHARAGRPARILAKMNALVDRRLIEELYEASAAGVRIDLIVRGICCLRPEAPGLSENIRVISIIDRFLEHARIFVFENAGQAEYLLASADWMPRNLDRRVEIAFPVLEPRLQAQLREILEIQLADTVKARRILPDGSSVRVSGEGRPVVRSQRRRVTQDLRRRHRPVTPWDDTLAMTTRAMGEVESGMVTRHRSPQSVLSTASRPGSSVLVVEDEQDVADLLRYNLAKEGYNVVIVGNGADALKRARETKPELILLDIMVPQLNGWEVCRRLKQDAETRGIPIIMVTGRVEEGDKVLGFEMGADDYVTKPFSPRELIARIRAVVRRGKGTETVDRKHHLKAGDLEIDRHRFEVTVKGQRVDLTPKEFELLATLVGTPGRVFGREELLDHVWGQDGFVEPRTVDVHVARLRAKFSSARVPLPGVETVRGVGYRFREPQEPA